MQKLILTSNGVSSETVERAFVSLIGGRENLKEKKVLVIRSTKKNPDEYGQEIMDELKRIGFEEKKIRFVNPFKEVASKDMSEYDIIYSAGGNTFVILDSIKKKGYDTLIREMIKKGKIYLGVSAGTIFLQKNIEIAGIGKNGDPNYIGLEDLDGLEVIQFEIFPHYERKNEGEIEEYEKNKGLEVQRLKDGECIVIDNGMVEKLTQ